MDGRDIGALLRGEPDARSPHDVLAFYYKQNDLEAIRSGPWKLHLPHAYRTMQGRQIGHGGIPGKYDYGARTELALFHLGDDIGETRDVSAEHPDVMARMWAHVEHLRADLGDRLVEAEGSGRREPGR